MNKEQIKYLLDNIKCEVKSNTNWVEPLGLDRDTWKALLEYIQQKDKEIERLQRQKEELQVNGLRQETLFKLEIERLNNIINESRRMLGEYKHFSTPTEEQNSENENIVDKVYLTLHENLRSDKE